METHEGAVPRVAQLIIFRHGEAVRQQARFQFGIHSDGRAGASIYMPVPGYSWRYARTRQVEIELQASEVSEIFDSARTTQVDFALEYLSHDDVWSDHSEKANGISRCRITDRPCVNIALYSAGDQGYNYYLLEASTILANARFWKIVMTAMTPHLVALGSSG